MRTPPKDPSSDEPRDDATRNKGRFEEKSSSSADDDVIEFEEASFVDDGDIPIEELELVEITDADFELVEAPEVILVDESSEAAGDAKSPPADSAKSDVPPPASTKSAPPKPPPPPPRQLVLIGAGHTHLQILKWWRRRPFRRTELTMVTAFDHAAYSAMLPSTLAGLYKPDEMLIDMPKLCEHCGVRLIVDRANRLDPVERVIEFAHQPALKFDVAAINIGSVPAAEPLWQSHRILISVKPLSTFLQRFEVRFRELVEQWRMAPGPEMLQIVVVGAGGFPQGAH